MIPKLSLPQPYNKDLKKHSYVTRTCIPVATVLLGKPIPNIVLKNCKNTLTDSILEIKIDINFFSPHSLVVIQNV